MKKIILISIISLTLISLTFLFAVKTVQKENNKRDILNNIKYDSIKAKRNKDSLYIIESAVITDFKFDVVKAGGIIKELPNSDYFLVISSDGSVRKFKNVNNE